MGGAQHLRADPRPRQHVTRGHLRARSAFFRDLLVQVSGGSPVPGTLGLETRKRGPHRLEHGACLLVVAPHALCMVVMSDLRVLVGDGGRRAQPVPHVLGHVVQLMQIGAATGDAASRHRTSPRNERLDGSGARTRVCERRGDFDLDAPSPAR